MPVSLYELPDFLSPSRIHKLECIDFVVSGNFNLLAIEREFHVRRAEFFLLVKAEEKKS